MVKAFENFFKMRDILGREMYRYGSKGSLLELLVMLELFQSFHIYLIQLLSGNLSWAEGALRAKCTYPFMLESFLGTEAPLWLADQSADKVFGSIAHFEPLFSLKLKVPSED